jgi:hypothetical protein
MYTAIRIDLKGGPEDPGGPGGPSNFNFKTTFFLISGPIFDKAAKLGKATWDIYNLGGWLIL